MKLALIATEKLPVPAIKGGAIQIYLEAVAPKMSDHHSITVFSVTDPHLPQTEKKGNVRYIRFPATHYVANLADHLQKQHYDVIHVCNRPLWIENLKKATPHSKFILSVHNEMFAPAKISDEQGKTCIADVSKIITVSAYIKDTITNRFPEASKKTEPVYSGVDLAAFHPPWTEMGQQLRKQMRQSLDLHDKKIILFVGRLSKVKGTHILLRAIPEIINKHPDAALVFVGSKWFGDNRVNKYVKHLYVLSAMYKDHVIFTKFIPPHDIPALYAMADVFVCSSQWQEPLARVHYEAMAAGLPILTTNRGGNPEVIDEGENGRIINDYDNPRVYAEMINDLLNDPAKRQEMGRYGRAKAEKNFGWEQVVSHLLTVYEEAYLSTERTNDDESDDQTHS